MTNNKYDALDALDELVGELEFYVAQEYQDHTYPSIKIKYDNSIKIILDNKETILDALTQPMEDVTQWQPIETAPHETMVLLCWRDVNYPIGWDYDVGYATWGKLHRNGISTRWSSRKGLSNGCLLQ